MQLLFFKQGLNEISKKAKSFSYSDKLHAYAVKADAKQNANNRPDKLGATITPNAAFVTENHYSYVKAKSPSGFGYADILITVNYTENVQDGDFVSVNSCGSRQYGSALNFRSWQDNGNTVGIGREGYWICGNVYGTLTIAYTDPNTGITATYTSDHAWNIGIEYNKVCNL